MNNNNILNLFNLSFLSDNKIHNNLLFKKNNKLKSKSYILKQCNKIKNEINLSNLAKLNNNNEIKYINNDLENKIKEIDCIINSLKYIEYYSN